MMNKDYNLLTLLPILNETRQTVLAAKKLNVSQPTVSLMLKKLRIQFNDRLFEREKNELKPTVKCKELLSEIEPILAQLNKLYIDDKVWHLSDQKDEIHLMFPPSFMTTIAAPLIKKITMLAPNLTVECSAWGRDALSAIEKNDNTWGVAFLPMETNKYILQQHLGFDKSMLVMRKNHPLKSSSIPQVQKYPLCLNINPGYIEPSKAEMLIKKYGIEKQVNLRSSDMGMMLKLVNESNYICVTSRRYMDILSDNYRWEPFPEEFRNDTFRREFSLFTHQKNRNHPITNWLKEEVIQLSS